MGEINSRHRGIEAIFHHMERGVYMKVVFHTPATYSQSTEMKKAMSEHFSSQITGKGGGADNLKRQQVRRPTTRLRVCKIALGTSDCHFILTSALLALRI